MPQNYSLGSTESARAPASDFEMMRRVAEASATAICAGGAADTEELTAVVHHAYAQAERSRRLLGALELAGSRDSIAMDALRLAVCTFTRAYRGEGLMPERVLIAVKDLVDNRAVPIRTHASDRNGNLLRESISTWCINAYFDAEGACI